MYMGARDGSWGEGGGGGSSGRREGGRVASYPGPSKREKALLRKGLGTRLGGRDAHIVDIVDIVPIFLVEL